MASDRQTLVVRREAEVSAVETWINPATGNPNLSRYKERNLGKRTNVREAQEGEKRRIRKVRIEVGFLHRQMEPYICS
ncbi:hypothetical protein E4U17_000498 [Claviceps sp. LM77 group G4]|nr:hypothetical protein E4U17_000498 [Claviceps sp. LM77 group G4]